MPEPMRPAEAGGVVRITIRRRALIRILWLMAVGLWSAYALGLVAEFGFRRGSVFGLVQMFDLDREGNPPTFFSATVLLLCALASLWVAAQARTRGEGQWRYWTGLAIILFGMCVDESASLHELLGDLLHRWWAGSGPLRHEWVIAGLASVAAFAAAYFRFWWNLPRGTKRRMAVAGFTYLAGALGMEMVSASGGSPGPRQLFGALCVLLEESLEMSGAILLLDALLQHAGSPVTLLAIRDE